MRRATRHDAAMDGSSKTPTDRLSRSLLKLRGARAVLRTAPLGLAAIARNASCAPGCGGRALTCWQRRSSSMVRVCQHPRRRACWELFYCSRIQAPMCRLQSHTFAAALACTIRPPIPQGGFERACEHNAQEIMRNPLNAALRAALDRGQFGCRPHNVRYVRCTPQRAKTLAVKCGEAPRCSMPAHPLRGARSLTTVVRFLCAASHPVLVASLLALLVSLLARAARSRRGRAAPAPSTEDGACHGRCNSENLAVNVGESGSPVDEGQGSASPSSTGEGR